MVDQPTQSTSGPHPAASDANALRDKGALAYVCGHFDQLREELRSVQLGSATEEPLLLRELRDALIAGRQCSAALDTLHAALLAAGDVLGLYGRIQADARGLVCDEAARRVAGVDQATPPPSHEVLYICPVSQCSRYSWPQSGPQPCCAMTGRALREDHL